MNLVPVKKGEFFAIVDDEDYESISQHNWSYSHYGYAVRRGKTSLGEDGKKIIYMHRFIIAAGAGQTVDHINGNRLDNRKENLRICTIGENLKNRKGKNGTSKYKGVSYASDRDKWRSSISYQNKRIRIGDYDSEIEAAKAYNQKAIELHGVFARINNFDLYGPAF